MQRTGIEYLTHTWNPLAMRCTPVSEGCVHCWHIAMAKRHAGNPIHSDDVRAAYAGHNVVLREKELEAPLRMRKSARIGVQFMGDLFFAGVSLRYIAQIVDVIESTPQHTYLILTKRPGRLLSFMDWMIGEGADMPGSFTRWPDNVWLGVTAENQQRADERIPLLLQCPAAVRFVSVEPMLGAVDFHVPSVPDGSGAWRNALTVDDPYTKERHLDWIICGGETGPGARTMDPAWARSVRDQCKVAGVPFFMKQMSGGAPIPDDLLIREWPQG